ncbi:FUN14 domain-containing protein 1A-like isoform X2 [Mya arenaria]|uniref:FUN14 domain-containing protein 1A-like isoform X2 n=1 Tax=Mya arenaria TaxID=6604 RepID=UPI0022E4A15C|nr:FUN14 domain-containing protein 1A-like isoform X2 [Mya arenaria]
MAGERVREVYDEIIDMAAFRRNKSTWEKALGDLTKKSAVQQVAIGGGAGWLSAYLSVKVGKSAALGLGATIVLVRIAQHQGYIQINWNRVNRHVEQARRKVEREAARKCPGIVDNVKTFVQQNVFLAGSFAGGFFIGLAF